MPDVGILSKMFRGYSLPHSYVSSPGVDELLRSLLLPDEQLLYHGSKEPIYDLINKGSKVGPAGRRYKGLFTSDDLTLPSLFAHFNSGYITPLIEQRANILDHYLYGPEPYVTSRSPHPLAPEATEYHTRFPGTLTPLYRRATGEHARGGLI